jgi:transposase InsO family protein
MPWKENNVTDLRYEFVLKSFERDTNFTKLCAEYGISTKCGYKWKERFILNGREGLLDKSKAPRKSPNRIEQHVVVELIRLKNLKKFWGAGKILKLYSNLHPNEKLPDKSTVERIFRKAGLTHPVKKRRIKNPGQRVSLPVVAKCPNHIWTVDFKGWWYTSESEKINPLTIRDDYSKYILSIKTLSKGDIASVKAEFIRIFKIYGLPEIIRSDNGPPFASMQSLMGLTKLSVWWISLGIKLDRIEPGKPYQNGGHERMHKDMARELQHEVVGNITLHQKLFEKWRIEFNRERPHEALSMKTPEEVYTKSDRQFDPEAELLIQYPYGFKQRHVNNRGYINWLGHRVMIGNPFNGFNVGIKKNVDAYSVFFGELLIGTIDNDFFLLISNPNNYVVRKPRNGKKNRYPSPAA